MPSPPTMDAGIYRVLLRLYPAEFRREFSAEMQQDFADACADAKATGLASSQWSLRVRTAVDVLWSALVQWSRGGRPAILLLAPTAALAAIVGTMSIWPLSPLHPSPQTAQSETLLLLLVAVTTFLIIAMTILATLWTTTQMRRRRRS